MKTWKKKIAVLLGAALLLGSVLLTPAAASGWGIASVRRADSDNTSQLVPFTATAELVQVGSGNPEP